MEWPTARQSSSLCRCRADRIRHARSSAAFRAKIFARSHPKIPAWCRHSGSRTKRSGRARSAEADQWPGLLNHVRRTGDIRGQAPHRPGSSNNSPMLRNPGADFSEPQGWWPVPVDGGEGAYRRCSHVPSVPNSVKNVGCTAGGLAAATAEWPILPRRGARAPRSVRRAAKRKGQSSVPLNGSRFMSARKALRLSSARMVSITCSAPGRPCRAAVHSTRPVLRRLAIIPSERKRSNGLCRDAP